MQLDLYNNFRFVKKMKNKENIMCYFYNVQKHSTKKCSNVPFLNLILVSVHHWTVLCDLAHFLSTSTEEEIQVRLNLVQNRHVQ